MPELPEIETVCRGLSTVLKGATFHDVVVRQRQLRFPIPQTFRKKLLLRSIIRVYRRAKYFLFELDNGAVLIGHLGMSGRMAIYKIGEHIPAPTPHDHVDFLFDRGILVRYSDPRRFGAMTLTHIEDLEDHKLLRNLGPEPLGRDFNDGVLVDRLKERKTSIKLALLDQRTLSGMGNIYVCESLFRSGISPKRKAMNVKGKRAERLVKSIKDVLGEAIAAGGSSLKDYARPDGQLGYFQKAFQVYSQEGKACPNCSCDLIKTGGIKRIIQGGRSTFYCSSKQR